VTEPTPQPARTEGDGVRVAVDAMGGDHGPSEVIPGALDFARSHPADQTHEQRDRSERAREHGVDAKGALNVDEDERENREVESVEGPSKEGARERAPLIARQFAVPASVGGWRFVVGGVSSARGALREQLVPPTIHRPRCRIRGFHGLPHAPAGK